MAFSVVRAQVHQPAVVACCVEETPVAICRLKRVAADYKGDVAALMPTYWAFGLVLVAIGVSAQTFTTTANSIVQLSTEPAMRGRVMAIFFAIILGCTPLGAPIVGWVADTFGPRWALGIGAVSGFAAAIVAIRYLATYRRLRVRLESGRVRFGIDADDPWSGPGRPFGAEQTIR